MNSSDNRILIPAARLDAWLQGDPLHGEQLKPAPRRTCGRGGGDSAPRPPRTARLGLDKRPRSHRS